ncbi:potassium-transporting ATPase subunit KdpA [Candidatus Methylospira mobilis]|uniref:Potassium-transporting ATPase potassium-binding subunit n=1 Tax=Candidatus Methylospira mobilis TaxID=1808979 RepID=A0A5Q0BMK8_9GAMM|nr:potassium-transporting ATPase subunit KdpA [Candidatus Methylospira mobilis]QFY44382.1 potassium-transporting ATPase subunit KdpA [Candidatus Methylospira mobilis]WNV06182.1 potassium-transporting ATPase subunit KdpA [Candidatus Methylospira mobilis]
MTGSSMLLLGAFLLVLLASVKPLGVFVAQAMETSSVYIRWAAPFERRLFRLLGIDAEREMNWKDYALALLLFNTVAVLWAYLLQRLQGFLPLNPQELGAVSADSALNTAISFITAACWQAYAGEATMSYLTQMLGLGVLNFIAPATGLCVAFALFRGFARHETRLIGNFWVDMLRSCLYILLPLYLILAVFLVSQGAIQNFLPYQPVQALQNSAEASSLLLPMGPAASLDASKVLGDNGGGFFNVNAAHPFENPTAFANFAGMLAMFLLPAALCYSFGRIVGDTRQGWVMFGAMTVMFVGSAIVALCFEQAGNPLLTPLGIDQNPGALQAGGNMEGKESRFGIAGSVLWAVITTASGTGGTNAMHDSFTPVGGLVPLWLMQIGEVVFGGVGVGLIGMIVFAMLAVFLAGLMIGRTPEYLGKKIESFEMKMVSISILVTPLLVLLGTAIAVSLDVGKAGMLNAGAHGFSEILYGFSSTANNNGSAFAGLSANTPFYNSLFATALWFGRFAALIPYLAIAGSLAQKHRLEAGEGTLPTHGLLFGAWLVGTVLIVGALTYFPALALGPFAEHFALSPQTTTWSHP